MYIHPTAVIDEGCKIGAGSKIWHFCHLMPGCIIGENCILGQNVMVAPGVQLGNGVKVQNNVSLYTGVVCEDDVFIGPSAVFTNVINPRSFINRKEEFRPTLVKKGASIGANATIVCGIKIGAYALVGAGAVVLKDVPDFALVVGNPARQTAWISRNGQRLHFKDGGMAVCPESGHMYQLEEGSVTEIPVSIIRSDSGHEDFISLVRLLDADLAIRDGADHGFYAQFNKIDQIKHVVIAYAGGQAVGCGAFKPFESNEKVEIKRMYVEPQWRGLGIAGQILGALEEWAATLGYTGCVLETGRKQPEAIALYQKCGYTVIPNFGQYAGVENSVCFEKKVNIS
jgi:UDP-2-acetamido-3-amino-2,3-dideoxy-glucuronate N-acetyltransferase